MIFETRSKLGVVVMVGGQGGGGGGDRPQY